MESESAQPPLKVCPNCSVASRTDSETCPSCGAPYERRRMRLPGRWWIAVAIILAAFALGYGGRKLIQDDGSDEAGTITLAQGEAVKSKISRSQLIRALDGERPALVRRKGSGAASQTCLYYVVSGQESSLWQFCFAGDELASASTVSK